MENVTPTPPIVGSAEAWAYTETKNCDVNTSGGCDNFSLTQSSTGLFWEKDDDMDELATAQVIDPVPSYCRDVYFNVKADMNAMITGTTTGGSVPFQITATATDSSSGSVSDSVTDVTSTPDWTAGDNAAAVASYEVNVNSSYKSDYFTGPSSVTQGNVYEYQVGYTLNTHSDVHSILDFPTDLFDIVHIRSEVWTSWTDFSTSNGSTTNRLYISNSNTIDYEYVEDNWFRAGKWGTGDGNYGDGVGDADGYGAFTTPNCPAKPVCNYMIDSGRNRVCYTTNTVCNQSSGIFTRSIFTVRAKRDSTASDSIAPAQSYHQGGSSAQWDVSSDYATLTYANVSDIKAFEGSGGAVVEWTTSTEDGTIGYDLHRLNESNGEFQQLNKKLLPAIPGSSGGTYSFVDRDAIGGQFYTYKLVETEADGEKNIYGPYEIFIEASNGRKAKSSNFTYEPRELLKKTQELNKEARKSRKVAKDKKKQRRQQSVKLVANKPGLYHLDNTELAVMFGVTEAKIGKLLSNNKLSLVNKTDTVPLFRDSSDMGGAYFYGIGQDGIYTDENIYWLFKSKGQANLLKPATVSTIHSKKNQFQELSFPAITHAEENKWSLPVFFDDPEVDYWMWEYHFAGYPGYANKQYDVEVPSPYTGGTAQLRVGLKGVSLSPDFGEHHARISINGQFVGDVYFQNQESGEAEFSFDASLLRDGANSIEVDGVLDSGTTFSLFYVNYFDIQYDRFYHAVDNKLFFQGADHKNVVISGFTTSEIFVLDITNPSSPQSIDAEIIVDDGGGYGIAISSVEAEKSYLAVGGSGISTLSDYHADIPSRLRSTGNAVDYLVIAPTELLNGAQRLADYRLAKGLRTLVVDIEDVMDEFNYGIYSPEAIRDFMAYAYSNWAKSPDYLVLLGNGTYDYKNGLGHGDNLMPVRLINTEHGLYSSDTYYVDVKGDDGIPELAVGRIPVRTAVELDTYLDKLIATEAMAMSSALSKVLMLADTPDLPADFSADSDAIAAFIPDEYLIEKIYLSDLSLGIARPRILDAINEGLGLVNFVGHSGVSSIGQKGMLKISDTAVLSNAPLSPIMTLWTCVAGKFELPGYRGIAEELLMDGDGGASAIFAASGLTENVDSLQMGKIFYETAMSMEGATLGSVIVKTKQIYGSTSTTGLSLLSIYNLLGDPAMPIQ